MKKRSVLVAGLLVATALAGCGGGGEDDAAAIEATVRTAVLSHDAAKCTEVMTTALREQVSSKSGKDALADCEEEAAEEEHDTKAVAVSNIEIEGEGATAEAAYTGGTFGGQTILLSLVERGGRWKVDRVVRITEFDRREFLAGAGVNLADEEETSPDQRRCIVARLGEASQGEIEDLLLEKSEAAAIELVRACPGGDYDQTASVQIENAIQELILGDEPSGCVEFATQRYLETTTGKSGTEAIAACALQQEKAKLPESRDVSDIRVDGPNGSAKVAVQSKEHGDEAFVLGLVQERGHWKVDRILRLISIDRLAFAKGVLEGFTESGIEVNPAVSACVLAKVRRISLGQFEALLFPLDTELSIKLFGPCAQASGEAPPVS